LRLHGKEYNIGPLEDLAAAGQDDSSRYKAGKGLACLGHAVAGNEALGRCQPRGDESLRERSRHLPRADESNSLLEHIDVSDGLARRLWSDQKDRCSRKNLAYVSLPRIFAEALVSLAEVYRFDGLPV
jgi:hypothetical protein